MVLELREVKEIDQFGWVRIIIDILKREREWRGWEIQSLNPETYDSAEGHLCNLCC